MLISCKYIIIGIQHVYEIKIKEHKVRNVEINCNSNSLLHVQLKHHIPVIVCYYVYIDTIQISYMLNTHRL